MTTPQRMIHAIPLTPVTGSVFQPTGFPDVGAATFERPRRTDDGLEHQKCLLVESAQSMANHLEGVGWDHATQAPVPELEGLPWVRVVAADDDRRYLTSSRVEAHRLAAAFVKDATLDGEDMKQVIRTRFNLRDDTPIDHRGVAREVFALDPLCLVHGVFFAESAKVWPGQPKIARALTAIIEAVDVEPVISGGVKRDVVRHSVAGGEKKAKEGYGSIPFHRQEFSAADITLHVSLDLLQLRSYGLGDAATDLLEAVALWELRTLLDHGLRLRTACDLKPLTEPDLPPAADLAQRIRVGVAACGDLLGPGGPIEVVWEG